MILVTNNEYNSNNNGNENINNPGIINFNNSNKDDRRVFNYI